jgi:flagellar motility protein MotE (MotC chaperone)
MINRLKITLLIVLITAITGCQTAYYSAMEQVGVHKRDILVDRVEEARESQADAQEQFKDALEQFKSVVAFDGGELDKIYNQLQAEYDDSVEAADDVSNRIRKVEQVSEDLFEEWEEELGQYTNQKFRSQSAAKLRTTKVRYKELIRSLKQAEKRMPPVLNALQDNVLYLKHNLNARAIGSLKSEYKGIKSNIDLLIRDMEKAIQDSDRFIQQMEQG